MQLLVLSCVFLATTYSTKVPGLSFQPRQKGKEDTLIWYRSNNREDVLRWTDQIDQFLAPYKTQNSPNVTKCEPGVPPQRGSNEVCQVESPFTWYPCVADRAYQFNSSSSGPCIFLKVDQIPEWTPEYYNSSTIPDHMPSYLKALIYVNENRHGADSNRLKILWVTCDGENEVDIENVGPISYHPTMGFDGKYFPFLNADGYLSPLVAIHFERPTRGVLISVVCKLWAKNINHDSSKRIGDVQIDLMVD